MQELNTAVFDSGLNGHDPAVSGRTTADRNGSTGADISGQMVAMQLYGRNAPRVLGCFGSAKSEWSLAQFTTSEKGVRQRVSFIRLQDRLSEGVGSSLAPSGGPALEWGVVLIRMDRSIETQAMLHASRHPMRWQWPASLARSTIPNSIAEFKPIRIIGQGSFGSVYQATHISSGLDVAIKAVPLGGSSMSQLQQEISCLHAVRRLPGVCEILGCIVSESTLYIVMEIIHGETLQTKLHPNSVLTQDAMRVLTLQLSSTIRDMHASGVVHRDIKPTNIVIEDGTGGAKLIDFGLAVEHWKPGQALPGAPADHFRSWHQLKGR